MLLGNIERAVPARHFCIYEGESVCCERASSHRCPLIHSPLSLIIVSKYVVNTCIVTCLSIANMVLSKYVHYAPHLRHLGLTLSYNSLYNNPDYSDLTIILEDSREVKVHKNILCTANEWFKKACGVGSRFAVRSITWLFRIHLLMIIRYVGSLTGSVRAQARRSRRP